MSIKYISANLQNGPLITRGVKAILDSETKVDSKSKARKIIQDEVFDSEDSNADNAKMITLLSKMVLAMYDTMTATAVGKLSEEDKALIEHFKGSFDFSKTLMGSKLSEDLTPIDTLIGRQEAVKTKVVGE